MDIATIYQSENFKDDMPTFSELYPSLKEILKKISDEKGYKYDGEKIITYNNSSIFIYINKSTQSRRYFICFLPANTWKIEGRQAYKNELKPAMINTLKFFESLPTKMMINKYEFEKSIITGDIETSSWTFSTVPDIGLHKISDITQYRNLKRIGQFIYDNYKGSIDKIPLFVNGSDTFHNIQFKNLQKIISPLFQFEPQEIKLEDSIIEILDKRTDKNQLFIFFFGSRELLTKKYYAKCKQYLLLNNIPCQFLTIENYENITKWGFENLLFELLKKARREDTIMIDNLSNVNVDGFLCLSDLGMIKDNKIFGISISFTGKGTMDEWLEIYNDIEYDSEYDKIYFEEDAISSLANKINILSNLKNKKIDIYVTKQWKTKYVGQLIKALASYNIYVNRFIYISTYTNRFVFSTLIDEEKNVYRHPYIIWDGKSASIQTNSKLHLYGSMFPVYIELLNPFTYGDIKEEDLLILLWLVQKRIYRIMNFYKLRIPEILEVFEKIKKIDISNIVGKYRINIHDLT